MFQWNSETYIANIELIFTKYENFNFGAIFNKCHANISNTGPDKA